MLNAHARSSAFVLASGALHLALSWAPDPPAAAPRRTPVRALEEMEFEVLAPPEPPAAATSAALEPPAPTAPTRRTRVPSPRQAPRPDPEVDVAPMATLDLAPNLDPAPAAPNPAPVAAASGPRDLSPLAAARTLSAEPSTAPSTFTLELPPMPADSEVDRAAEARLTRGIAGLTREGEERVPLDQRAFDFTALVSKPWEVILRPLLRPRYQFHGAGFDAIIRADGSVQYRDKNGLHIAISQTLVPEGQPFVPPSKTVGLGFRFGGGSRMSELRTFFERTRPLRDLLHDRWRRVALARADALLALELKHISIAIEADDDQRAHKRLFKLWDESSEDDVGAVVRKRIERFTREQCGPGSQHSFSAPELTAFNSRRVSRQRFDPYAEDGSAKALDAPDAG